MDNFKSDKNIHRKESNYNSHIDVSFKFKAENTHSLIYWT